MITRANEYFALYHQVTSGNPPDLAVLLPNDENIYHVDLNTRTIEAPAQLGVTHDQRAEVIYFAMDRYYDNLDLAQAIGVIEYINANNEAFIYGIPFYDIETLNSSYGEYIDPSIYSKVKSSREQILFPWIISSDVTAAAGTIEFAMSFYILDKDAEQIEAEGNNAEVNFLLRLNLLPTTTEVLQGIEIDPTIEELEAKVEVPTLLELLNRYRELNQEYALYWDESASEVELNPPATVGPYQVRIRSNVPADD